MSHCIRYFITESKMIDLTDLEAGIRQINPGYEIDADILLLDEEEYGQIDINEPGDGLFESELELARRFAEKKAGRDRLQATLQDAKRLVVAQAIWSGSDEETIDALRGMFGWLQQNYRGILMDEGGTFYDNAKKPIG